MIWSPSIPTEKRPARSSLYRVWPEGREAMIDDIVMHLVNDDLYNVKELGIKYHTLAASAELAVSSRKHLIATMGKLAVETTNHLVASRVEAAVSLRAQDPAFGDALIVAQEQYISTLAHGYELAHLALGDSIKPTPAAVTDYAKTIASTARAIGLNAFGLLDSAYENQYNQFDYIAAQYTETA
jgi:hypothetical protein